MKSTLKGRLRWTKDDIVIDKGKNEDKTALSRVLAAADRLHDRREDGRGPRVG